MLRWRDSRTPLDLSSDWRRRGLYYVPMVVIRCASRTICRTAATLSGLSCPRLDPEENLEVTVYKGILTAVRLN
jgi:hypothetical protein